MAEVKIIDNFLDDSEFDHLYEYMMGPRFLWYYNDQVTIPCFNQSQLNYQFTHCFFRENEGITGDPFNHIIPCLNKLDIKFLLRSKCNLNPKTEVNQQIGDFHSDYDVEFSKTAILYVNTNNGFTLFENGTKVESVANRLVIFNTIEKHVGYSCTDQNVRVVINFNYIPFNYES